ncbi:MAG: serine/threonine protein kinase [Acidobacteria bacterium]|nr:serine/threonine protein kinase [Acidobacteriota bacterium]
MAGDELREIDRYLELALDLPEDEREQALLCECPDPNLRRRVLDMLARAAAVGGRIEAVVDASAAALVAEAGRRDRVGPYRLIRELGVGGMGVVWLAERADGQFEQKVAIKRIRHVLASDEMKARFRTERRILAGLQHPNIAHLIDGGTADDGTLYLALEYVDGQDLSKHAGTLPVAEKLRLFLKVCGAVEYAHRNLVVHRDLKMSNILVTPDGEVKLLDFGIAKVIEQSRGTQDATETQAMTPEYASPEQVLGRPVTTLSDVYSLGAILYVLLAERSPYRTNTGSPAEFFHAVATQEVTPPSLPGGKAPADLAVIVLKAMRKDPERRYQSAAELASDLRLFLEGRPISARPDSLAYRARKFAGRNPWAVAASALALALLVAFVLTEAVQSRRLAAERDAARRERDNARWLANFMVGVFRVADPRQGAGDKVTARELLDRGAQRLEAEPRRDELRAIVSTTIGRAYFGLGLLPAAEKTALEAYQAARASRSPEALMQVLETLESLYIELARPAQVHQYALEHLTAARTAYASDSKDAALALTADGAAYDLDRRFDDARARHAEALAMLERLGLGQSSEAGVVLNNAANAEYNQGGDHRAAAREFAKRSVEILRKTGPPEQLMSALNSVAVVAMTLGDFQTAEPYALEGLAEARRMYGPRHLNISLNYNNLCGMYTLMRRVEDALRYCEAAVDLRREGYPAGHRLIGISLNNLGKALLLKADWSHAEAAFREALGILSKEEGGPAARSAEGLGFALKGQRDWAGSLRYLNDALNRWMKIGGSNLDSLRGEIAEVRRLQAGP